MSGLGETSLETIRKALQTLLASADFQASERNRRFLEHVVEETLAGRADRIKAYSIATKVFGRDDSFDAQADPIVRIEASRLRRALERYYLTAGSEDAIRIAIPKGSYVPCFERTAAASEPGDCPGDGEERETEPAVPEGRPPATTPRPAPRRARPAPLAGLAGAVLAAVVLGGWLVTLRPGAEPRAETDSVRHGPSIFVSTFASEGDEAIFADFGKGFTREIIIGLTRFDDLFVFGPETTFRYGGDVDHRRVAADLGVDFVLAGGTAIHGDRFEIETLLIDAGSGQYLWAERFEGTLGTLGILGARDEIAENIARSLAQPYGVIFDNRARDTAGRPPDSLNSYECVTRFYLYWRAFRQKEFAGVRDCLERAIARDSGYAEAFAALSLVHSDAYRFGFGDGEFERDPRETALALARRSIEIAPQSARAHHALALALWLAKDIEGSLAAAEAGLAFNPNDTELMAELGMRYVWRNEREKGIALVREAFARNPAQPSGYRLPLFLDHYIAGRHAAALDEARKIGAENVIYGHLAVALAAGQLGLGDEATAAVDRMLSIDPGYAGKVVTDLERRNIHPDLIPVIVEGLRKAGMDIDGPATREKS